MSLRAVLCVLFPVLALAVACAGPRSMVPVPGAPVTADDGTRPATAEIAVYVPPKTGPRAPRSRHQRFIVASTKGVQVIGYKPHSKHTKKNEISSLLLSVSSKSKSCKPSGGGFTCTGTIGVKPPAMDFVATTWDALPLGGKPKGKQLAAGSLLNHAIKTNKKNTVKMTLGGVPATLAMALPSPTPVAGINTIFIHGVYSTPIPGIGVSAFDADGNLIVADDYEDASGTPSSISVTQTANASTCGSGNYLSPIGVPETSLTLSTPDPAGVTFEYGATSTAQLFSASSPCSFTLAASIPGIPSVAKASGAVTLLGPTMSLITVTGKHGASSLDGIAVDAGGAIWFADTGGEAVGTLVGSPSPVATEYEAANPGPAAPYGITLGTNNNLWFTENGQVATFNSANPTSVKAYPMPTPFGVAQLGEQIVNGPADVLDWVTSANADQIYSIGSGGGILTYTPASPLPGGPVGITAYPTTSGKYNLFIANQTADDIEVISPNGTIQAVYPLTGASQGPQFLVEDSLGNVWFTAPASHSINELNLFRTTISVTPFVISPTAQPWGLGVGPDGAIWFADLATNSIGRVPVGVTNASQITEYPIAPAAMPKWVITAQGKLWFTAGSGAIGAITY